MAAKVTRPISPLRRALAESRLRESDVAEALGVDPKTVQRWLAGRLPQPRHRWGLADLLHRHEYDLWPQLSRGLAPTINQEILATYTHRGAVPRELWRQLFAGGESEIGILAYAGLFLAEDIDLVRIMRDKAEAGVTIRILLGDPDCEHVALRGAEEGIAEAMAAKIRNVMVLYRLLLDVPAVEIRLHTTVLYNSIYRADNEMLVNPHVYGTAAAQAPVLHLQRRRDGDLFSTYADSFERVWTTAKPSPEPA
ncbi:MAG: XRE family transcriptional regulator [Acidimicrobiia bacterium]